MKNYRLRSKIRQTIDAIPLISADELIEKDGIYFRINRMWVKELVDELEKLFNIELKKKEEK
jgi:hypothetical protein